MTEKKQQSVLANSVVKFDKWNFSLSITVMLLSLITSIFIIVMPFGTWTSCGMLTVMVYFSLIGDLCGNAIWFRIVLAFLLFAFILCILATVFSMIYSTGKMSFTISRKRLGIIGFIPSYIAFTLTVSLAIAFAMYSSDADTGWEFSISFYFTLISSLMIMIYYITYTLFSKNQEILI